MIAGGLRARITCLNPKVLDRRFAGREFDAALLAELPPAVDPCGERGEFHTCAYAGPMFRRPVPIETGITVERDGFVFTDLTNQSPINHPITQSPDNQIRQMTRYPSRIVCLTEETTETLYLLGQGDRIVGVSGYTVRPPEARQKPKVSAFINAKFDKIEALEPDLVLAFSDLQADLAAELVRRGINVVVFNQRIGGGDPADDRDARRAGRLPARGRAAGRSPGGRSGSHPRVRGALSACGCACSSRNGTTR